MRREAVYMIELGTCLFLSFTAHKSVSMVFVFFPSFPSFLLLFSPFEFFRVHFVPSRVSFPRWLAGSV